MARQVMADAPKTRLVIQAAVDDGFMVMEDYRTNSGLIPSPPLFAGTLQQCADYIVREMTPAGQAVG